jgi:DNA-nicking Smr family endonuclease
VSRGRRVLAPEEAALWQRVIASVTPLAPARPVPASPAILPEKAATETPTKPARQRRLVGAPGAVPVAPAAAKKPENRGDTLDASWDRRLARGLVSPESTVDLHGHSLASAYDRLDRGLEMALQRGDRVLLLVTGKPPRPESERPHARGAIRAAVGDWLAGSRHAGRIAAVRGAHPRHGGSGALYIVLRRPRTAAARIS